VQEFDHELLTNVFLVQYRCLLPKSLEALEKSGTQQT
jgi:hypothetical protein